MTQMVFALIVVWAGVAMLVLVFASADAPQRHARIARRSAILGLAVTAIGATKQVVNGGGLAAVKLTVLVGTGAGLFALGAGTMVAAWLSRWCRRK